jgi:hypothetical protein
MHSNSSQRWTAPAQLRCGDRCHTACYLFEASFQIFGVTLTALDASTLPTGVAVLLNQIFTKSLAENRHVFCEP